MNFWRSGTTPFKGLQPNDMFLFKLKLVEKLTDSGLPFKKEGYRIKKRKRIIGRMYAGHNSVTGSIDVGKLDYK